jgi:hypothetical protein
MEIGQITVTQDGRSIVGWQDGTTAARIIWKHREHDEHVHGREVVREGLAIIVLRAVDKSEYQLVSAELVAAVTPEDLMAAIAPGNRDVALVETKIQTQRCACADEVLYTITARSSSGTTMRTSLTNELVRFVEDSMRQEDPSAEITVESYPNPEYRPECRRDILEDEAYIKYVGEDAAPALYKLYCQRCGIALWGEP